MSMSASIDGEPEVGPIELQITDAVCDYCKKSVLAQSFSGEPLSQMGWTVDS